MWRYLVSGYAFVIAVIAFAAAYQPFAPIADTLLRNVLFLILRLNAFPLHDPFTAVFLIILDGLVYAVLFWALKSAYLALRTRAVTRSSGNDRKT